LAIVVSSRESCCAKTTFAKGHDGRPLGYESGRLIHHSVGHDQINCSAAVRTGSLSRLKVFSLRPKAAAAVVLDATRSAMEPVMIGTKRAALSIDL
jgi:hypothetical protein